LNIDPEPVLIDCPPLTQSTITALKDLAGTRQPRFCSPVVKAMAGCDGCRSSSIGRCWCKSRRPTCCPMWSASNVSRMSTPQPADCVCFGPQDRLQAVPLCSRRPLLSCCSAGVC
jgi:hypothetical protein